MITNLKINQVKHTFNFWCLFFWKLVVRKSFSSSLEDWGKEDIKRCMCACAPVVWRRFRTWYTITSIGKISPSCVLSPYWIVQYIRIVRRFFPSFVFVCVWRGWQCATTHRRPEKMRLCRMMILSAAGILTLSKSLSPIPSTCWNSWRMEGV